MRKRTIILGSVLVLGLAIIAISLLGVGPALAEKKEHKSTSDVFWTFESDDPAYSNPNGTSTLSRTKNGISANYKTSGLTRGNAETLWFVVFNYPEECEDGPYQCSPLDFGDTDAQGDFFIASGHVIGADGKGNYGGHLNVGDVSGSGLAEMLGCQDCTPGLIEPESALVVSAIHDHGPALTGQALKEQISTFLGDCDKGFLGNEFGFATGPDDIPVEKGYCSTIQMSPHAP